MQTNTLSINAVVEGQPSASISTSAQLTETNLDAGVVRLTLTNETFADNSLSASNFNLNNVPSGTTIQSVNYVNSTSANINLAFNGTDFDTDYNFSVTASQAELSGSGNLQTNTLSINAVVEGDNNKSANATTNEQLTETNLNNAIITLNLTNETFTLNGRNQEEDFILNNAPNGLTVASLEQTNNSELILSLNFTGDDFTEDIENFSITILSDQLTGDDNIITNALTIKASESTNVELVKLNKEKIKVFPNPNKGKFTIEINSQKNKKIIFKILNIKGQKVFEKEYNKRKGKNQIEIDIEGIKKGIYTIISNSKSFNTNKIIIH